MEILLGMLSTALGTTADRGHRVAGDGAVRIAAVAFRDSRPHARVWQRSSADVDSALGGIDSCLCSALRPAAGARRPTAIAVDARSCPPGRGLDTGEAGSRSRLQQRTLAPPLPPSTGTQPDAPGHLHTNAPGRRTARNDGPDDRSHRPGGRLP